MNDSLSQIPDHEYLLSVYEQYLKNKKHLKTVDKLMLYRFMQDLIGCVNYQWKESAASGARYSSTVTQSDESMGFFVLK